MRTCGVNMISDREEYRERIRVDVPTCVRRRRRDVFHKRLLEKLRSKNSDYFRNRNPYCFSSDAIPTFCGFF